MTYDEVFKDWSYLFDEIGAAYDMTGGYVDSEDLDKMLKSPNKKTAKECMINQIVYWLDVGTEQDGLHSASKYINSDDRVNEINERYS